MLGVRRVMAQPIKVIGWLPASVRSRSSSPGGTSGPIQDAALRVEDGLLVGGEE
jgi:hypothetical protein